MWEGTQFITWNPPDKYSWSSNYISSNVSTNTIPSKNEFLSSTSSEESVGVENFADDTYFESPSSKFKLPEFEEKMNEENESIQLLPSISYPQIIDVGLHPAALLPPGYYRQNIWKERKYLIPTTQVSETILSNQQEVRSVEASLKCELQQRNFISLIPQQLKLIIPHAAGELAARPIKRRHTADLEEDDGAKRQKLDAESANVKNLALKVEEEATECSVSWDIQNVEDCLLKLPIISQELTILNSDGEVIDQELLDMEVTGCTFTTTPGSSYKVRLRHLDNQQNVTAHGEVDCKAVFSLFEMDKLLSRALICTGTRMQSFTTLYRCKPKIYFDDIYFCRKGLMEKYRKDNNGQAASPINSEIYGLFFSARTQLDGTIAPMSCFGDMRMEMPAKQILDPNHINLYFCDFYCYRLAHYVTVVVCEKGSDSDEFCKNILIPLDLEDNSFLRILQSDDPNEPFIYYINMCVWVEIYYTENVLMKWGKFFSVKPIGSGGSAVGGIPHNKACLMCNLYPMKSKAKVKQEEFSENLPASTSLSESI